MTPLGIRADILSSVRHPRAPVLSYRQQLRALTQAGFVLWDIMKRCTLHNSDDTTIADAHFNDVPGLLSRLKGVRRVVFCNGATTGAQFVKHFAKWIAEEFDDVEVGGCRWVASA